MVVFKAVGCYCFKLFLIIIAIFFVYYLIKYFKSWFAIRKLPGPLALPFIGNAYQFNSDPIALFLQLAGLFYEYQPQGLFSLLIGNQPVVVLIKANKVESILSSTEHLEKATEYRFLHPWLSTGLLTSAGDKWRHRRKLLTPSFHFQIMDDFLEVFCEQSEILVNQLRSKVNKEQFDIFKNITLCALDIICEAAMGKKLDAQTQSDSEYVKAVYTVSEIVFMRMLKPWLAIESIFYLFGRGREQDRCIKILHDFTDEVIQERVKKYQNEEIQESPQPKRRLAFLDLLLESAKTNKDLTPLDIREEVDTFMFEGHDTTAAAISWAIYLIGTYPEVQRKLQEEIDSICEGSTSKPTMEDIKRMKYLDCVIKETLRLFPSVPIIGRNLTDKLHVDNYVIPKGTTIVIGVYGLHRDPEFFPDPEEFIPERFDGENTFKKHPFSYIPFSAGSRNCIGQRFAQLEDKVVLSYIIRNFNIKSMQHRDDLLYLGELILRPANGIIVKLFPRN